MFRAVLLSGLALMAGLPLCAGSVTVTGEVTGIDSSSSCLSRLCSAGVDPLDPFVETNWMFEGNLTTPGIPAGSTLSGATLSFTATGYLTGPGTFSSDVTGMAVFEVGCAGGTVYAYDGAAPAGNSLALSLCWPGSLEFDLFFDVRGAGRPAI